MQFQARTSLEDRQSYRLYEGRQRHCISLTVLRTQKQGLGEGGPNGTEASLPEQPAQNDTGQIHHYPPHTKTAGKAQKSEAPCWLRQDNSLPLPPSSVYGSISMCPTTPATPAASILCGFKVAQALAVPLSLFKLFGHSCV